MHALPLTNWIWLPDADELVRDEPVFAWFRKSFEVDAVPEQLIIRISADTRYKLYVNGCFAEYGPARGDNKVWYVDEVNISPWLVAGENVLAIVVLRYPMAYRLGNFGMWRTATPGLYVKTLEQDVFGLSTDETWTCFRPDHYQIDLSLRGIDPLLFTEKCFGAPVDNGWKCPGYHDDQWEKAKAYNIFQISQASSPGDLSPRPIPLMQRATRRFQRVVPKYSDDMLKKWNAMLRGTGSVRIEPNETCVVEIDAGEEMTGFLSLRVAGGNDAKISILYAESYYSDREIHLAGSVIRQKGDRCDWVNGELRGNTDTYRVSGYGSTDAPEEFAPFWWRTFRFIRLEIKTQAQPCTICGFDYQQTGYPLEVKTSASASDGDFAGIWDISLRTLQRCMQETYIDCPYYEQLQYAMDARSEILFTYTVSHDDRMARQCMDDFRRSQRSDGLINACYPHWGPNVIPGFSIYYILMVYDHMMYFGDESLVRKHLSAIDQILQYFEEHLDTSGIVGKTGGHISDRYWSFVDWSTHWGDTTGTPPSGLTNPITMESLLYIDGLQHAAYLCDYVGRHDTAAEYRCRAEHVQNAINQFCRDEDGFYTDSPGVSAYSQHAQVFAVLTDTVPGEDSQRILKCALADSQKFAPCSVSMMFYLFRALEKAGLYGLTEPLWNPWRQMLKDNLTTCVENDTDGRSDCHAWGSLILYELPAVILGVRPGAPGYGRVIISPNPGFLQWAKGTVTTPWGDVQIAWEKKENGKMQVHVDAPTCMRDKIITKE